MTHGRAARIREQLTFRQVIMALGSLKLGVACLFALFLLVLAGTLYQAEFGLYAAQKKFFHAWIGTVGGVPFPGAQAVLTVLAVNLLVSTLFRISFRLRNVGLFLIHTGLIVLIGGAFQAHIYADESLIALAEGEEGTHARDPRSYRLIVGTSDGSYEVPARELQEGTTVSIPNSELRFTVDRVYRNARPVIQESTATSTNGDGNSRRLVGLEPRAPAESPGGNRRGMRITVSGAAGRSSSLHLFSAPNTVARVHGEAGPVELYLRPVKRELPFTLRLEEFRAEFYPRSDIPKSFSSRLTVQAERMSRTARISMNKPLRIGNYTVYQSSYAERNDGSYVSVLAVVRNPVRELPYVVALLIAVGLVLHIAVRARGARTAGGVRA